ncbi:MAG: sugar ABC transporter permease [Candidatus Sumerlaeia bacterium]
MSLNRSHRSAVLREHLTAAVFLGPFLIVFGVFIAWPVVYSFWLSLHKTTIYSDWYDKFGSMRFVGLQHYRELLTNDVVFWWSLLASFIYALLTIPTGIALALFLAITLNRRLKGAAFFRSGFFLPFVFDLFVVGVIWLFLYNPTDGLFSKAFQAVGINYFKEKGFLSNPLLCLPSVALAVVLKGVGFGMVLFLTALNNISESVFEAAELDGCTGWQKVRFIVLPLVRPIMLFMLITGVIGALNAFAEIYAMTGGGPSFNFMGQTVQVARISGYHLFRVFDESFYGRAAAISYVLLFITLIITAIQFKLMGRRAD